MYKTNSLQTSADTNDPVCRFTKDQQPVLVNMQIRSILNTKISIPFRVYFSEMQHLILCKIQQYNQI